MHSDILSEPINADLEYFQRLANGYYVVEKKRIIVPGLSNNILACAVIPVFYNYRTESAYLPQRFAHSENAAKKIKTSSRLESSAN